MLSVAGRAVRSAFYLTLAGYAMQVIGFVTGVVLARRIEPDQFGIFGLALSLMLIFARVKLWGFNRIILAETDPDDLKVSTQFWMSTAFSLLVFLLLLAARPLLRLIYSSDVVLVATLIAALSVFENEGLASTPETMLARDLRYGLLSLITVLSTFVGQMTSVALALGGLVTFWALFAGYAAKTLSYFVGVWAFAPRRPRLMFSLEEARGMLRQGRFMFWGGVGTFLAFQYDDIAVGTIVGTESLGYYRRAYDLSLVPMSIIGGVLGVTAATYAKVKENREALSETVSFILDAVALIALPASVGLALVAPEFVALVYGEKWLPAVPMLRILLLYSMVRPLNDSIGALAPTLGRFDVDMRFGIVESVVMLVSCTALTLLWGANGAALSAGLTVVVGFYIFYRSLLRPYVDVNYRAIFVPPLLALALGTGVALLAMKVYAPPELWGTLFYKGAIFSGVYGAALLALGRQNLISRLRRLYSVTLGAGRQPQTGPAD